MTRTQAEKAKKQAEDRLARLEDKDEPSDRDQAVIDALGPVVDALQELIEAYD